MIIQNSAPFPLTPAGGIPTDALAFYEFENNLNDSSGNSRTATAPNSLTYGTGKIGTYSADIDGTSQYIELPADAVWDDLNGEDFSCFMWFKSTDKALAYQVIGNYSTLTAVGPTPNQFWQLVTNQTTGTGRAVYRRDNGAQLAGVNGTTDICDGDWHYIGFVKDGVTIELWVDNVREGTASLSVDGTCANNQEIRVGIQFARYQALAIDNLRIFDRLLTADEKTALYNEA